MTHLITFMLTFMISSPFWIGFKVLQVSSHIFKCLRCGPNLFSVCSLRLLFVDERCFEMKPYKDNSTHLPRPVYTSTGHFPSRWYVLYLRDNFKDNTQIHSPQPDCIHEQVFPFLSEAHSFKPFFSLKKRRQFKWHLSRLLSKITPVTTTIKAINFLGGPILQTYSGWQLKHLRQKYTAAGRLCHYFSQPSRWRFLWPSWHLSSQPYQISIIYRTLNVFRKHKGNTKALVTGLVNILEGSMVVFPLWHASPLNVMTAHFPSLSAIDLTTHGLQAGICLPSSQRGQKQQQIQQITH